MSAPVISIFGSGDYAGQVRRVADELAGGRLVVVPTETVYGVAGLLSNPAARQALQAMRGGENATDKPFTLHLARAGDAERFVGDVSEFGRRAMRKLWPGPVALMVDVPADVRDEAAKEAGVSERDLYDAHGVITLRCPDDTVARDVIAAAKGPVALIAAGSMPAGSTTHSPATAIADELGDRVSLVVDGGPTKYAQPSTILRVREDGYDLVRKGVYDERIIERLMKTTILFVCSGNTCRSPMAEALARGLLSKSAGVSESALDTKGLVVGSAGAYAMPGSRATPQAVEAVRGLGGDLGAHRSRQLTPELIHQADLIFTMGRSHAMAVTSLVPSAKQKVATLDPLGDIEDPIGGSVELYRSLAGELKILIENRLREQKLV